MKAMFDQKAETTVLVSLANHLKLENYVSAFVTGNSVEFRKYVSLVRAFETSPASRDYLNLLVEPKPVCASIAELQYFP